MCKSLLQLLRQAAYKHGGAIMNDEIKTLVDAVEAAEYNVREAQHILRTAKEALVEELCKSKSSAYLLSPNMGMLRAHARAGR